MWRTRRSDEADWGTGANGEASREGYIPPLQIAGRLAVMPVGGDVPDAPQVSSSQRVGRRAASPLAAAEGEGFLPAMPKIKGRKWQSCGPGMPGPYRLAQTGCAREGQGRAAARPFVVCGGCPETGCCGRLRAAYMPPLQSSCYQKRGFGGTPDSKVEEGPTALRTDSNTASV